MFKTWSWSYFFQIFTADKNVLSTLHNWEHSPLTILHSNVWIQNPAADSWSFFRSPSKVNRFLLTPYRSHTANCANRLFFFCLFFVCFIFSKLFTDRQTDIQTYTDDCITSTILKIAEETITSRQWNKTTSVPSKCQEAVDIVTSLKLKSHTGTKGYKFIPFNSWNKLRQIYL